MKTPQNAYALRMLKLQKFLDKKLPNLFSYYAPNNRRTKKDSSPTVHIPDRLAKILMPKSTILSIEHTFRAQIFFANSTGRKTLQNANIILL